MSTFRENLFSGLASRLTSNVAFVGDAEELTIQLTASSAASAHIHGSNDTGFQYAVTSWSTLTSVAVADTGDLLNIEPGFRFVYVSRNSNTLSAAVIAGRNDAGK